jgi:hypothetical protein
MSMKPVLKDNLQKFLVERGIATRIFYRIVEIRNPENFRTHDPEQEPPKVGESFTIEYDYKDDEGGYFGYEHLTLLIGRQDAQGHIHNYVQRFSTVEDLVVALQGVTFELDKDFARTQIQRLQGQIEKLKRKYEL